MNAPGLDDLLQAGVLVFTVAALWLIGKPGRLARWGYLAGLAGQPFYLTASWRADQWGMFLAAVIVTGLWWRGAVNHFGGVS